jgi:hypothetical protein
MTLLRSFKIHETRTDRENTLFGDYLIFFKMLYEYNDGV